MSSQRPSHALTALTRCAALLATVSGCLDPCLGTERSKTTLTASLSAEPDLSSTLSALEGESAPDIAGWPEAIANATAVQPGIGLVRLQALDASGVVLQQLNLTLPFPLSQGQVLPIVPVLGVQGRPTFSVVPPNDPNLPLPLDAAGMWLISGAARPDFDADRVQSPAGTATVTSVSPLRVRLAATVSYPAESGRPGKSFDGEVVFETTQTSVCLD